MDEDIDRILTWLDRMPSVLREGDTLVELVYRVNDRGEGYWVGHFGDEPSIYGETLRKLIAEALWKFR